MNSLLLAIPGGASIALIVVAILLLFGGKKIPELMRGLGKGISEFKKGKNEIENELNDTNENNENKEDN
jgi:sec-independent protein translocase protein TatA